MKFSAVFVKLSVPLPVSVTAAVSSDGITRSSALTVISRSPPLRGTEQYGKLFGKGRSGEMADAADLKSAAR